MNRILCVDDDRRTLDALVSALREAHPGAVVDGERDATAALDRLTAEGYDCLISDDGRTAEGNCLAGTVRARYPEVSVLLRLEAPARGTAGAANGDASSDGTPAAEVAVMSGDPTDRLLDAVRRVPPATAREDGVDASATGPTGATDGASVAGADVVDGTDVTVADDVDAGRDGWTLVDTVDWERHDAPDVAVVLAVEAAWGRETDDGPPSNLLYDVLDGDALARLLQSAAGNGAAVAVEFAFGGHEVRVGADGRIVARPLPGTEAGAGAAPGD